MICCAGCPSGRDTLEKVFSHLVSRATALSRLRPFLLLGAILALGPRAFAEERVTGNDVRARHAELRAAYRVKLAELAAWADQQGLTEQAQLARAWVPAAQPSQIQLACRPAPWDRPEAEFAAGSAEWRERWQTLRNAQATAVFDLANTAVENGHAADAFAWLVEVIRENPAHAEARKILGYVKHEGQWLTPFEAAKAREGQVWHPRFGWLPRAHIARYEAGERFYNNRWLKAEDEERLRARKGLDIATEHYSVHTTHSLEEGVRLATRLERLYDAWQQMFAGFSATEAQLARRFAGQAATSSVPVRHKVVYFRDREEYVTALVRDEPNIGISSGFYVAAKREAYFYATGEEDDSNLYHEATHQLFNETRRAVRNLGEDANYWVVEGVACYMESLSESNGWHLLGGENAQRLRDAVHRRIEDDFYLPLAELVTLGMNRLKQDKNIAILYSQASGLTYFLINYDEGRYRDALVAYLAAVYQGRDRPGTLAELCNSSDEELDDQYRQYIESLK